MFLVKLPPFVFTDPSLTYRFRVKDMLVLTVGRSRLELILIKYNALDLRRV
jgi:hypothetical protein